MAFTQRDEDFEQNGGKILSFFADNKFRQQIYRKFLSTCPALFPFCPFSNIFDFTSRINKMLINKI